jgi:hypothetical protein
MDAFIRAGLVVALAILCFQIPSPFVALTAWALIPQVARLAHESACGRLAKRGHQLGRRDMLERLGGYLQICALVLEGEQQMIQGPIAGRCHMPGHRQMVLFHLDASDGADQRGTGQWEGGEVQPLAEEFISEGHSFFRGLCFLCQICICLRKFVQTAVGGRINVSACPAAWLALTLDTGAPFNEIWSGGVDAILKGVPRATGRPPTGWR